MKSESDMDEASAYELIMKTPAAHVAQPAIAKAHRLIPAGRDLFGAPAPDRNLRTDIPPLHSKVLGHMRVRTHRVLLPLSHRVFHYRGHYLFGGVFPFPSETLQYNTTMSELLYIYG